MLFSKNKTINLSNIATYILLLVVLFLSYTSTVLASNLPIASTVELSSSVEAEEGSVVIVNEESEVYLLSAQAGDSRFYGVTAKQPPVVFSTGTNTVPIITEGVTKVRVNLENGPIVRGDLLVTASEMGVAKKANDEDKYVFAIALEPYDGIAGNGLVQAEVGVERALALREARQVEAAESDDPKTKTNLIRGIVATVLVVGALLFVLFSFRSAIVHSVTSVGRNPRARIPIMTLSVANIIFALLLCAVVVFIAVAILVLPL